MAVIGSSGYSARAALREATTMFERKIGAWIALTSIGWAGLAAPAQTAPGPAIEPAPAYEVATIKPWDQKSHDMPLRMYIQGAFDIPYNVTGRVIGPDWIRSTRYAIQGKPPDSIRDAMQRMTPEERGKETRLMEQALLADRFKLKAHFETREMPTYQLVALKGGPKLKASLDAAKGRLAISSSSLTATAVPMKNLVEILESTAEIDSREVIDTTGLSGLYDISLKWAAISDSNADGPSLFTALQEIGLKLVPARSQVQVLVIDHIETPSDN